MPSDNLPNGVMSNLALIAILPLSTIATMNIKSRICDTYRRMPTQYSVDKHMGIVANMLAFSLLVMWATYLPGNQNSRLQLLVVLDILGGLHVQRYLLHMIHAEETAPYHAPGPLALARRARRQKLSLALVSITSASGAAFSVAIYDTITSPYNYSHDAEYVFIVFALPAIHSAVRTVVLDMQGCRRQHTVDYAEHTPTNDFTITDDDGSVGSAHSVDSEDSEGSCHDDAIL